MQAALDMCSSMDQRIVGLVPSIESIERNLSRQYEHVQRAREDLDIEYSLATGAAYIVESPDGTTLRSEELHYATELRRAGVVHRRLNELSAFVTSTTRAFSNDTQGEQFDPATTAIARTAAIEAQELERQRLAREIHDGPAQALANAIIALEFVERAIRSETQAQPVRAMDEVERIKSTLRDGLNEIRRFIFDLKPTMLQDRGLVSTVRHYVDSYQSLFDMAVDVTATDMVSVRLTSDQELTAFRIVQEAIQNARKHSRASRITVDMRHEQHAVLVCVADNGRGFSPERVSSNITSGAGLKGMRERAALVGGELTLESTPGDGTVIRLRLPLSGMDELVANVSTISVE